MIFDVIADKTDPIYPLFCEHTKCIWHWTNRDFDVLVVRDIGACVKKLTMARGLLPREPTEHPWQCPYFHHKDILIQDTS